MQVEAKIQEMTRAVHDDAELDSRGYLVDAVIGYGRTTCEQEVIYDFSNSRDEQYVFVHGEELREERHGCESNVDEDVI